MNIFVKTKPGKNLHDEKQWRNNKTFPIMQSRPKCSVDRSLALTLYVSRLFGIAPVSLEKSNTSVSVCFSPGMYAYSCLLLFILYTGVISGVVLDFYQDSDQSVRLRSATASLAWAIEIVGVTVLMTFGVCYGRERMNSTIRCLNVIEKVKSGIPRNAHDKKMEQTVLIIGKLFLLFGCSLYVFDFYIFLNEALLEGKDIKVVCLYMCFYIELVASFPLELQFMDIVMKVVSTQKAINNALMYLIRQIDKRDTHENVVDFNCPSNKDNFDPYENFLNTTKCVNLSDPNISKKDIELFHYLILSYGAICDVMKQINESNSAVLVILLLCFFLRLVLAPYYLISYWMSTKRTREASALLQILISIFHIVNVMVIVEPAHRNTQEMENTQALLGQLARRITSPSEPLFYELDLFYKQILLNPVSFRPMGFCSLTRPIITTIFGGVTTYVVIILQFRALEQQIW